MAGVQRDVLRGAARAVRPGGVLVYATCTLEREENDSAVEEFLAQHPDFSLDGEAAILRVFPGEISTDGSFAARLRRVK
jgi:16S rRNA (cytosine967-C5)-methyltransferase